MNIKIAVDYYTGNYDITSYLHEYLGKKYEGNHTIQKPINGKDGDGHYKRQFSKFISQKRKYELEHLIDKLNLEDPSLKLSKEGLKNVDYTIYKSLK